MYLILNRIRIYMAAVAAVLILSQSAAAQDSSIILQGQNTPQGEQLIKYIKALLNAPELVGFPTVPGIDSATTAPDGVGFISIAASERTGVAAETKRLNGTIALGMGIGSAETGISIQPTLTVTSVEHLGESGYAGIKFSRQIQSGTHPVYAGISFNRLSPWGDSENLDSSHTLSASGFSSFINGAKKYPLMWTLGLGSNVKNGGTESGVQAGIGMGVYKNTAFGFSTNGDVLNAGLSINLPNIKNVNLAIGFADIFDDEDTQSGYIALSHTFGG